MAVVTLAWEPPYAVGVALKKKKKRKKKEIQKRTNGTNRKQTAR